MRFPVCLLNQKAWGKNQEHPKYQIRNPKRIQMDKSSIKDTIHFNMVLDKIHGNV